jgi:hypothetical protein
MGRWDYYFDIRVFSTARTPTEMMFTQIFRKMSAAKTPLRPTQATSTAFPHSYKMTPPLAILADVRLVRPESDSVLTEN